ncbi:NAD-dependent epimerase/dehydratase family protein [candidate division WOR-3 bacterium]|nr:NAD-dependent epimerase/dehydratase family protein [candidate division WOR-3 bacterium]
MNFLVTGGAGFIGSNIVEELLKRGHRVRVLDNFSTGRRVNLDPLLNDIELIEGDVRSPFTVMEAMDKVDYVLHQAALPSVPRSIKDPLTTNEVCVVGTLNVLKAALARKVKRVVYASSSSVYGDSEELPKHERMTPNPLSPYACAKLAGENYCQVFSRLYGLETVALRYFNVFGPHQDPTSQYAAVIPKFIAAIREGRQPVIYGDGEQSRDFTPVINVVRANLAACDAKLGGDVEVKTEAEVERELNGRGTRSRRRTKREPTKDESTKDSPSSVIGPPSPFLLSNVAVGERYTLNFIVNEICRVVGRRVKAIYDPPRPGDVRHSLASIEVMTARLGLTHRTPFVVGLEQLTRRSTKYEEPRAERIRP